MTDRELNQLDIVDLVVKLWGEESLNNLDERIGRVLEEVIELAQTEGYSPERIKRLVDHVYSRPVGDSYQEVGGVCLTLLAYCHSKGIDIEDAEHTELGRVFNFSVEHAKKRRDEKRQAGVL